MQLIEGLYWLYLNNKSVVKALSIIGLLFIWCQPIGTTLLFHPERSLQKTLLISYLILATPVLIYCLYSGNLSVHIAQNGHLAWDWLPENKLVILTYLFFLCAPIFLDTRNRVISSIKAGLLLASAIISYITYNKYKTWGSMWCWFVNIACIFVVIDIIISMYWSTHMGSRKYRKVM